MNSIFLSASVPIQGRGNYFETADPFLIQFSVRELLSVTLGRRKIVWGGHPAITPMVLAVCEDLGIQYARAVTLYQSKYFSGQYPTDNQYFANAVYVDAVPNDLNASLKNMRYQMLNNNFESAVFIGGMEGIFEEYQLFTELNPKAKVLALGAPGGASRQLAEKLKQSNNRIDFAKYFYETLEIDSSEKRMLD